MIKLSNFVIKFKEKCVFGVGKKDLRKEVRSWKKEFLLFEKTKHVQLIYMYLCFATFSSYPTRGKE
jgi:hypothetical protein